MYRGREHGNEPSVSRLYLATGLSVLGLLVSGCASTSGTLSQEQAFDPAAQEDLPRPQRRAGAEPTPQVRQAVAQFLSRGDALYNDGASASAMWAYLQAHELDLNDPLWLEC